MRVVIKLLGIAFALFGVLLLSLFPFVLGEANRTSDNGARIASGVMVVLGFAFIYAGRHYLRLNPGAERPVIPASNFTRFLVNHRRQFKVLAQTGAAVSVLGVLAALIGWSWTFRRVGLPLVMGMLVMDWFAKEAADPAVKDDRDWMRVPPEIRSVLSAFQWAMGPVLAVMAGLLLLSEWPRYSLLDTRAYVLAARVALYGVVAFTYALQALFFKYGDLRTTNDHAGT